MTTHAFTQQFAGGYRRHTSVNLLSAPIDVLALRPGEMLILRVAKEACDRVGEDIHEQLATLSRALDARIGKGRWMILLGDVEPAAAPKDARKALSGSRTFEAHTGHPQPRTVVGAVHGRI